jgi:hypothetical protein
MEIQSFFLCKTITQVSKNSEFDGHLIGLHSFYSLDGNFPLEFDFPYFMLLRRETRGPEQDISLRFNLINSDGITVGEPRNIKTDDKFPAGFMFLNLMGKIHFNFPGPGDYRLDITADEESAPFTFQYNIEITR